jgi:hypothetical protein
MNNPVTLLTPEQIAAQESRAAKEGYLVRDLIALDMGVNVITDGLPDETISSRLARAALKGKWWGKAGSKVLDLFQKDHGAKAMAGDTIRGLDVAKTEDAADGE